MKEHFIYFLLFSLLLILQSSNTLAFSGAGTLEDPWQVTDCGTFTTGGYYLIENNISTTGDCIIIQANSVNINGGSFIATGNINASGVALGASAYTGLAISNLTINGSVISNGASGTEEGSNGGIGGTVTIINSDIDTINTLGGTANSINVGNGGNGGAVNISGSSTVGNVDSSGGDSGMAGEYGGNGGNIEITNSTIQNITTNGGVGISYAGDGGNVDITGSDVITITTEGGSLGDYGGDGGDVTIIDSTVSEIVASGEKGVDNVSGHGGDIIINNSEVDSVISIGGGGSDSGGAIGGKGGDLTIYDSIVPTINVSGGDGGGNDANGGNGGLIIIDNSEISVVSSNGGIVVPSCDPEYNDCLGGSAGDISLIDSDISLSFTLNLVGGTGNPNGSDGSITFTNTTIGNSYGSVKYTSLTTADKNLSGAFSMSQNNISLDSGSHSDYNIPARISFNNLRYYSVKLLKDSVECLSPDCVLVLNDETNGIVTFDVTAFSSYSVSGSYLLSYTAGANGSIVGISSQIVDYGSNGTLVTATPATGYHFVKWSDNNSTVATRTDTNATANISTSASFAENPVSPGGSGLGYYNYTINASAGINGSISPNGPTLINYGGSQTYTITPSVGYKVTDVLVDGISKGVIAIYTFSDIASNHTISVTFEDLQNPEQLEIINFVSNILKDINLSSYDSSNRQAVAEILQRLLLVLKSLLQTVSN